VCLPSQCIETTIFRLVCLFVAAGMRLPSRGLAMDACSGSAIPASCHSIIIILMSSSSRSLLFTLGKFITIFNIFWLRHTTRFYYPGPHCIYGVPSPGRVKNFVFSTSSRPALGATQPPIQWVPCALSPRERRPGCGADHSPLTSVDVKKMCVYTTTNPAVFN
jgi:hypothetical protein